MKSEQRDQHSGQDPHMNSKEPCQGDSCEFLAATHDTQKGIANKRGNLGDASSYCGRPKGFLIPGQQVACESETDHYNQKPHASEPGDFPRYL